ncbi:LysM peptidoglycan-binding domain-containing protein [Bacillus timonensis]|uniref:LysM peptidoglycan-binding domain-containing protein n=1 Tax=Bacillus timonensis TaxID=1033734 RepID=A0A4S3PQJ7_9BACI|nr:glycosyl hydrolase family 18 protein [Bacillus timonensis]THE11927.1 LysM peptidoglycan-binding domain-containing protein [Bacillus timonensis]
MKNKFFLRHQLVEDHGHFTVILHLQPFTEELASELMLTNKEEKYNLRTAAMEYVNQKFPFLKRSTIVVMAGAMLFSTFTAGEKAEAHEANFNMTYLYFGNTKSYISQIDRTKGNMNLVAPSYFDLNQDGSLKITTQFDPTFVSEMHNRGIKVVPFLSNHWDRNLGRSALQNREQLSTQIANFIIKNNLDGVQVDIENVSDIDQQNYTDLVRLLRQKLPKDKEVSVAVAANPNGWTKGWHGSYDYKELAKYSNYLMIMAYDESYTGGPEGPVASYPWVERSIQYALNQGVPASQIVLGIPFYGRYWKAGATTGGDGISNTRVDEMLAKYGGTIVYDEKAKSPKATVTIGPSDPTITIGGKTLGAGTYTIWFENSDSIKAKIDLVHKYNLKGTGSWSLGQENPVIWNDYKMWMTTHQSVITPSQPVTPSVPTVTYPTYTVQSGDSLWKIATTFGLAVAQLKQYNYLTSETIFVGQVLYVVPPPSQSTPAELPRTIVEPVPITPEKIVPIVKPVPKIAAPVAKTPVPKVAAPKAATPAPKALYVGKLMIPKATKTAIRSGSSTTNKVIKYVTTKDEVKVIQEYTDKKKTKWVKVQHKGTTGWMLLSQVKLKPVVKAVPKPPSILKTGSTGTAVKDLQTKLRKLGYYKQTPNSKFDMTTRSAIIAFQKKYKLKVDGIAGPQTISTLNSRVK